MPGYKANPAPYIQPHGTLPHLRVSHSKLHPILFSASFRIHAAYYLCKSTNSPTTGKTNVKCEMEWNNKWKVEWIVEQLHVNVIIGIS